MNYIQMPLHTFLLQHPEFGCMLPPSCFHDNRYVVRIHLVNGTIEFGYPEDEWEIK